MIGVEFKTTLINSKTSPEYRDAVPKPKELGCSSYWYIEWIYIPEGLRRKGVASKLIRKFCANKKRPILVYLVNNGMECKGKSLEPLFINLGFKVIGRTKACVGMLRK